MIARLLFAFALAFLSIGSPALANTCNSSVPNITANINGPIAYVPSTCGWTSNTSSSSCGGAGGEQAFRFTPSYSGSMTITTTSSGLFYEPGSNYDTVLYVREGGCNGSELDCNDDSNFSTQSTITFNVNAGTEYYVFVKINIKHIWRRILFS